jgi:hypothetical protein
MGLSFTIAAGPRQRIHPQVRVPQDSWPHFTVSDSRLPLSGAQVPLFISPRNRVAQLYTPALGALSIAFYDSQGYGGGNSNPPPHPGGSVCYTLTHKFESFVFTKRFLATDFDTVIMTLLLNYTLQILLSPQHT